MSKTALLETTLLGKGNLDCLAIGHITQGKEDLEQVDGTEIILFILLKGIWPNL